MLLRKNLNRTKMSIEAMEKIKAYNRLYRMGLHGLELKYHKMVKVVQDQQLEQIEQSCGEHAIISLATAFETYYKELLQQLLSGYPDYFLSRETVYSHVVNRLIEGNEPVTYEGIERALKLTNRFDYYTFFKTYSITFLSADEEEFIEYIVLQRNNYVHNAGRPDTKTRKKLSAIQPPFDGYVISTEAKRLRTKFRRTLFKSYDRIISILTQG